MNRKDIKSLWEAYQSVVSEKAVSQQQQKLMGLALAYKRGEISADKISPEAKAMADKMSEKDLEDFAKTKHKGLPVKKEEEQVDEGPDYLGDLRRKKEREERKKASQDDGETNRQKTMRKVYGKAMGGLKKEEVELDEGKDGIDQHPEVRKRYDAMLKTKPDSEERRRAVRALMNKKKELRRENEEAEQIDEISAKLARKAAAMSVAKGYEYGQGGDDDDELDRLDKKSDKAMAHVKKRQGEKGVRKVGRLANKAIFGRSRAFATEETELEEKTMYVVRYSGPDKKGDSSPMSKAAAEARAKRGNAVDKVGGKYTVVAVNAKGHDVKESVNEAAKMSAKSKEWYEKGYAMGKNPDTYKSPPYGIGGAAMDAFRKGRKDGEAAAMKESVDLQEAASPHAKAAAHLEKMIKDPKFVRFYGDDIDDIKSIAKDLKSSNPTDHKNAAKAAKSLDTIIRDIVSDAVHKNSSKEASNMWHNDAGMRRMKEENETKEEIQIDEKFDRKSPAHQAAKKSAYSMGKSNKVEYHSDGSATVHHVGNAAKGISPARVADHHHDVNGLGYGRSAKEYSNLTIKQDGLEHKTTGSNETGFKTEITPLKKVKEAMDPVNKKALKKDFDDRKDKDIDNDGDVDSSDEYLHNRRKAINKAISKDKKGKQAEISKIDEAFEDLWTAMREAAEPANRRKNATPPEGLIDKESPKSKEFVAKHEVEVTDEEPTHDTATAAGRATKPSPTRPGDNKAGDKNIVNPVKSDAQRMREKIMDVLSGKTWKEIKSEANKKD